MAEKLRYQGKVTGVRIIKTADWWYASITVELEDPSPETRHQRTRAVGIDVGLNRLATLSTGEEYENQAFLKTAWASCVGPTNASIGASKDQRTVRKPAAKLLDCTIRSRA